METPLETLERLKTEAFSGALARASTGELECHAAVLCHPQAFSVFGANEFPQICETVRVHLIRAHIGSLQEHITSLNNKNNVTQYCVIALTVAALIGTGFQTWYGYRADKRAGAESAAIEAAQQLLKPAESSATQAASRNPTPSQALPKPTIGSSASTTK